MTDLTSTWPAGARWSLETMSASERTAAKPAAAQAASDDRALVRAAAAGSREAFDEIVVRHRRAVYRLCHRFAGNHEDAADLTQQVFLRAYRGLDAFRGESAIATWLYRIAVNASLNFLAARRPPQQEVIAAESVPDRGPGPETALLADERAARVRRAVASLPDRQRATIILRVYHDLPYKEIASVLGGSIGAAKANVFHALRNLRRLMNEEPGREPR